MKLLRDFPLAWRWTDPQHAVLPEAVLQAITPVEGGSHPADASGTRTWTRLETSGDPMAVRAWLRALPPRQDDAIIVAWSQQCAVRTTWGIFAEYWDDFCYPSSDDVSVQPVDDSWLLRYHHFEVLDWSQTPNQSLEPTSFTASNS